MKYLKQLSITIISVLFLQACDDNNSNKSTPVIDDDTVVTVTIVDAAVANGGFTTLVAALQTTGLDTTLSDVNSTFTVFAPTDAAFALLGQETIEALLADPETLSNILTYHVFSGEVDAASAISLAGTTVNMVNGDALALSLDGENLLVNTATVITTDIQTDNGIIHVIDAVLLPPNEMAEPSMNIVETAVENGSFTTLVTVLQATGLDTVLADESATFTVFAPTDAAFELIDSSTIAALLDNTDVLSNILLQHVIAESAVNATSAYTLNGEVVETASMAEIALKINSTTDMLTFGGANIVMKDIYTTNGIIHVIDAVIIDDVTLPAPSMNLVDIAASNASFSTLVGALQATGLDTVLADDSAMFTVFAPTDEAFAKLPDGMLDSLTTEQLSNILLYHVVTDSIVADNAIAVAQLMSSMVETANTNSVALSFVDSTLFVNGAKVSSANILASNGIIHVLDNVLLPPAEMVEPTQNIVEIALADPDNFSTLVTALTAADLVTTLSNSEATFTVFAPTNAAFDKIDPDALAALLADTNALSDVLLTHVVSDAALSELEAYAANGQMLTATSGNKVSVSVNAETGMLMIGDANVVISNVYATNGVIHVIDTVIMDE